MADIFGGAASGVAIIGPAGVGILRLPELGEADEVLISSFKINAQPNYQLLSTLSGKLLVNSFSQRVSTGSINGTWTSKCTENSSGKAQDRYAAAAKIMKFYSAHVIGTATTPLAINYAGVPIDAYLTSLGMSSSDPETVGTSRAVSFMLEFIAVAPYLTPQAVSV